MNEYIFGSPTNGGAIDSSQPTARRIPPEIQATPTSPLPTNKMVFNKRVALLPLPGHAVGGHFWILTASNRAVVVVLKRWT